MTRTKTAFVLLIASNAVAAFWVRQSSESLLSFSFSLHFNVSALLPFACNCSRSFRSVSHDLPGLQFALRSMGVEGGEESRGSEHLFRFQFSRVAFEQHFEGLLRVSSRKRKCSSDIWWMTGVAKRTCCILLCFGTVASWNSAVQQRGRRNNK